MRFFILLVPLLIIGCSKIEPEQEKANNVLVPVQEKKLLVLDIPSIAGKPKEEVEDLIGKVTSCEPSKYGETCSFTKANTEIVFINGKADWITVSEMQNVPYNPSALALIGLPESPPSFMNDFVIRWQSIPGYVEVSLNPAGEHVSYAYVKVSTY